MTRTNALFFAAVLILCAGVVYLATERTGRPPTNAPQPVAEVEVSAPPGLLAGAPTRPPAETPRPAKTAARIRLLGDQPTGTVPVRGDLLTLGESPYPGALATSDASGLVEVPEGASGILLVRARGYQNHLLRAGEIPNADTPTEVHLTPTLGIAGRVRIAESSSPAKGIPVVCWLAKGSAPGEDRSVPLGVQLSGLFTMTDDQGDYFLDGVQPGEKYYVSPATDEYGIPTPAGPVAVPGRLDFTILPKYEVVVRLTSADGTPLLPNPKLREYPFLGIEATSSEIESISTQCVGSLLPRWDARDVPGEMRFQFLCPGEAPTLGQIRLNLPIPGYDNDTAIVTAYRSGGPVSVQTIVKRAVSRGPTPGTGQLRIRLVGLPKDAEGSGIANLILMQPDNPDIYGSIELRSSEQQLDGIPLGTYYYRLQIQDAGASMPENEAPTRGQEVTVRPNETPTLEFDLALRGGLRMLPPAGASSMPPCSLEIRKQGSPIVLAVPYLNLGRTVVFGFSPGVYNAKARIFPGQPGLEQSQSSVVTVQAGQISEVRLAPR